MNIVEPAFGNIPIELIRPSKTNPRKRFDEAALAELAESIKKSGVGQPILVRPMPDVEDDVPHRVEIVAGERRYRASKLAGLATIPAIVRDMPDAEVLEFQLVKNLQREDVHPIEEAEGYQRLMNEHHLTADQVAEKVGKSRSYIYGRLKLCALCEPAREAFYDGKLSASTALLVARIPVPALQEQATKEILTWNGEPMSYRAAVAHVQRRYMLDLAEAPFPIADIKLVPAAGACGPCPKRTGNQPEIFADIDNADVCTDPDCFAGKKKAQNEKLLRMAQKKGIPVYDSDAKDRPGQYNDQNFVRGDTRTWRFDRMTDKADGLDIHEALTPEQRPQPASYIQDEDDLIPVYEKTAIEEALEKAGLRHTLEQYNAMMEEKLSGKRPDGNVEGGLSEKEKERQAKLAEIEQKVQAETAIRVAAYKQIRAKAADGLSVELLRAIAKEILNESSLPEDELPDLYDFDTSTDEAVCQHIEQASIEEVGQLLLDMLVAYDLSVTSYGLQRQEAGDEDVYSTLENLATAAGVDIEQIRAEMTQPPAQEEKPEPEEEASPAAKKKGKSKKKPASTPDPAAAWPFPEGTWP